MAVHVSAEIVPGKLELLRSWVPNQPWTDGTDTSTLTQLGSYRFDDPDGEVGMETHLLRTADGNVLHVPLTYRGAPQPSGDESLITTMTHSVLGDRWIYDGCCDEVYVRALANTILTGGVQAELFQSSEAGMMPQPVSARVQGSGAPNTEVPDVTTFSVTHDGSSTLIRMGITLTLLRIPGAGTGTGTSTLTGTWPGQQEPMLLATIGY